MMLELIAIAIIVGTSALCVLGAVLGIRLGLHWKEKSKKRTEALKVDRWESE